MTSSATPKPAAPKADEQIVKRGFGLKAEILDDLNADYHSAIIEAVRENGYAWEIGGLRLRLAKNFGFCYGVDKAIDFAYETRRRFPGKRIFLTNEIIHNPRVNRRLVEMGIQFLAPMQSADMDLSGLTADDVVLIPAFGVPRELLARLSAVGCVLVDTTCGSVVHVWKRVERYARDGFTSIVHGKFAHEETQATVSHAMGAGPLGMGQGKYLVLRDEAEARELCEFIRTGADAAGIAAKFGPAASADFDFTRDLERVGCANQTTMLSSESLRIAGLLREAMIARYGEAALDQHFRSFDTICNATQERQDAVLDMIADPPDLMLVIGGFNSSNTGHLCEIASERCPTFHIDEAAALISADCIRHKPAFAHDTIETRGWLPSQRPLTIGLTSGASTPNKVLGEVIERLAELEKSGESQSAGL